MDDEDVPFASHITKRGRIYQYVRRVPEDLADAFPFSRIQRSLRTVDRATAYEAGARVHSEVEKQFAGARRKKGATLNVIPTDDWDWSDWRLLADWFKATLAEDDWRARLTKLPGAAFRDGVDRDSFWRDNETAQAHLDLQARLRSMSAATYSEERFTYVQSAIRRLGVPLSRSGPYFDRFMSACLKAEMEYLATFFDREGGKMEEGVHPDAIQGKWRAAAERVSQNQVARILGADLAKDKAVGRKLSDCLAQWQVHREQASKSVTKHGLAEKKAAIDEFETHARVSDIGEITRAQLVRYRDHLFAQNFKTPTINKKVGQITTLLATAHKAGWIDETISGGIYIEIPAGTNEREPFEQNELVRIFSQDVFRNGDRSANAKAAGILEFWLPLISVTSGLISTEILQLGPDTIGPHPDHPEIICYEVTNAGGRAMKTFARKRYVPIRSELWANGIGGLVESARARNWRSIWPTVEENSNITSVSNMFSAFWSDTLRNKLAISDEMKTLYSLRHNFRDAMAAVGAADFERWQLMGHAEQGMGKKYGTKRKPRAVDIVRLDRLIQSASWPFFAKLSWPKND